VAALDAGADDYVTKPFDMGELLARMRVALRHALQADGGPEEPIFEVGELRVDRAARRVHVAGQEVHLTPTEYRLLAVLVQHAGRVLTHRQLLKEVWGVNAIQHTHYLRVYMTQLRHKLEPDPTRPRYFQTELGVGYRLRAE
jgi:two-component system KDP operon response regulator KdpE